MFDRAVSLGRVGDTLFVPREGWSRVRVDADVIVRNGRFEVVRDGVAEGADASEVWVEAPLHFKRDVVRGYVSKVLGYDVNPVGYVGADTMKNHLFDAKAGKDASCLSLWQLVRERVTDPFAGGIVDGIMAAMRCATSLVSDADRSGYAHLMGSTIGLMARDSSRRRVYVWEIPEIAAAWDAMYADMVACFRDRAGDKRFVDVVTGRSEAIVPKFWSTATPIVASGNVCVISSVLDDKKSFASYGFSGNEHGGIGFDTESKVSRAVDWLVASGHRCYFGSDGTGTQMVFWGERDFEICDNLRNLLSMRDYVSVNTPRLIEAGGLVTVATLRPNKARLSVRSIETHLVADLARNRDEWESSVRMGDGASFDVSKFLYGAREFDGLGRCGVTCESYFRSVVYGEPYSPKVLSSLASFVTRDASIRGDRGNRVTRRELDEQTRVRAALMRGYLVRMCDSRIGATLEDDNFGSMYSLGRLIAVLECAQLKVSGAGTVRSTFMSQAALSPRRAATRVLADYMRYSGALRRKSETVRSAAFLDCIVRDVLGPDDDASFVKGLPEVATDEGKLELYVGFFHQQQALR